MKNRIDLKVGVAGLFKLEAECPDGRRRTVADWQNNLITDVGLLDLGQSTSYMGDRHCSVGTGNSAPAATDNALDSRVATVSHTEFPDSYGGRGEAPYYWWSRKTYRFSAGAATGNISELGLSHNGDGSRLFTRALIKDTNGNPTSATILPDEILDVTYEVRMYPITTDTVQTITISGVDYTFTIRASDVALSGGGITVPRGASFQSPYVGDSRAYSGAATLGPITGGIQGGSGTGSFSDNTLPPVPGALYRDGQISAGVGSITNPNGISAIRVATTKGIYQMTVSPPLPKDHTNNISLTFRISWARYVP